MSSEPQRAGETWKTPPAEGHFSADGERYRLRWYPAKGTTKTALFRVCTDDYVATLQHIRTITLRQRGETAGEIDADVRLEDVPSGFLGIMRDQGLTPANCGEDDKADLQVTGE